MRPAPRRHGFSVFMMLAVIAIILFLIALLIPAVQRVRQTAGRSQSINNLKQIGLAMHGIHDVHGKFPPIYGTLGGAEGTYHYHVLPYIEQDVVYRNSMNAVWRNDTAKTIIPIFSDPLDVSAPPGYRHQDTLATTNYVANWMVFKEGGQRFNNILDGTSNTLCHTTRQQLCNGQPTAWGYPGIFTWTPMFAFYNEGLMQDFPTQNECDPRLPQSITKGTSLVGMCDGSVRTASTQLSASTWYYLCSPNDGHAIGDF